MLCALIGLLCSASRRIVRYFPPPFVPFRFFFLLLRRDGIYSERRRLIWRTFFAARIEKPFPTNPCRVVLFSFPSGHSSHFTRRRRTKPCSADSFFRFNSTHSLRCLLAADGFTFFSLHGFFHSSLVMAALQLGGHDFPVRSSKVTTFLLMAGAYEFSFPGCDRFPPHHFRALEFCKISIFHGCCCWSPALFAVSG